MALPGRKPKRPDQLRNRSTPRAEWTEVIDLPNENAPKLPPRPARPRRLEVPAPPRPLGSPGRELWERAWSTANFPPDRDSLLQLCEQVDERAALRVKVLSEGDWRERNGLRMLDAQVTAGLTALANAADDQRPLTWPTPTKRWWTAISRMPHTTIWLEADWQFAMDTAYLVAAYHAGNLKLANEIRTRERWMGTTADARRDLRIRYVPPDDETEEVTNPSVTAMADYRRQVTAIE